MFRSFMKIPYQIFEEPHRPAPQTCKLFRLPVNVVNGICDELHVLDRCSLALTCKRMLRFAEENEHLDYIISRPPNMDQLDRFFGQLGRGWIPQELRYCPDCGKFLSTDPYHWRHVSEKYTREHTGRIAELWRERREDGWLRYWIERWCDGQDRHSTAAALKHEDTTDLLCPRCAIQNPETNEWRVGRLAQRNQRHAGRSRRLVSPGIHSPYVALNEQASSPELRGRSPVLERRNVSGLSSRFNKPDEGESGSAGLGIHTWI